MSGKINGFHVAQFIIPRAEEWRVQYAMSCVLDQVIELLEEERIDSEVASDIVLNVIENLIYSQEFTREDWEKAEKLNGPPTEQEITDFARSIGLVIDDEELETDE